MYGGRPVFGGVQSLRGLSFLQNADIPGIHELYGFDFAEPDALGIAVAKVTLDHLAIDGIKVHRAKRTHRHAGATTDAGGVIDHHTPQFFVVGYGADRAADLAGGVLALLAGHGNINPIGFPLNDSDPATDRIGYTVMLDCAHQFAQAASSALFMVDHQNFFHFVLLSQADPQGL
jgi:hypothetical protein